MVRDYLAAGENEEAVRKAMPHLTPAQIKVCLLYYERYPEEIRAEIDENESVVRGRGEAKTGRTVRAS